MRLRERQQEAKEKVLEMLAAGKTGLLAVMPEGYGKTLCFAHILKEYSGKAVVLCPTIGLADQVSGVLKDFGLRVETFHTNSAYNRRNAESAKVIVTLPKTLCKVDVPYDLLIFDECHHAPAETWKQHVAGHQVVGFTATPVRADEKCLREIFKHVVVEVSKAEGVRDGYLVQPIVNRYDFGDRRKDFNTVIAAVEQYGQTLAFVESIDQAELMARLVNQIKPISRAIHSRQSGEERNRILDDFRKGRIQLLFNVSVLNEGIDVPGMKAVALFRNMVSPVAISQAIGRAMRPLSPPPVEATAEERRAFIAASEKPVAYILDFNGIDISIEGHALEDVMKLPVNKAQSLGFQGRDYEKAEAWLAEFYRGQIEDSVLQLNLLTQELKALPFFADTVEEILAGLSTCVIEPTVQDRVAYEQEANKLNTDNLAETLAEKLLKLPEDKLKELIALLVRGAAYQGEIEYVTICGHQFAKKPGFNSLVDAVAFAESVAAKLNGLPNPKVLEKEAGWLYWQMLNKPEAFEHIPRQVETVIIQGVEFERRKGEMTLAEAVVFAESVAAKLGGLPNPAVFKQEACWLYSQMQKSPDAFAHIPRQTVTEIIEGVEFERKSGTIFLAEAVVFAEEVAAKLGGLPLGLSKQANWLYTQINNNKQAFAHIPRQMETVVIGGVEFEKKKGKLTPEESVAFAEEIAAKLGGLPPGLDRQAPWLLQQIVKDSGAFAHIPRQVETVIINDVEFQKRKGRFTLAEGVAFAEEVAAKLGALPALNKKQAGWLIQQIRNNPEAFAHIPRLKTVKA